MKSFNHQLVEYNYDYNPKNTQYKYVVLFNITRWWFQICFIFTPKIGEMIQFD